VNPAMTIEITDWLRKLGLEQYAPAFRDNAIDSKVLPRLSAEDLKDLGVTMVGHRRRLLDAIAALSDEAPAALVEPTSRDASESVDAERRQVTVMFCDLVGSTALSTRFDPEDLQEVIGAYQREVTEAVTGLGGFVAKYMGDGVLVYFGYPQAHEDDAERAVDCARSRLSAASDLSNSKYESASLAGRWSSAI
jgi:class 3 adenylate cyclase